jgi:hypothetical protein
MQALPWAADVYAPLCGGVESDHRMPGEYASLLRVFRPRQWTGDDP